MPTVSPMPPRLSQQRSRDTEEYRDIIKAASNDFCTRERNFFLNLSDTDNLKLSDDKLTPLTQFRNFFEFMLTLSGLKPCTLIMQDGDAQAIITRMAHECLLPVMIEYDLDQYGFRFDLLVDHEMHDEAFQDACLFTDTRSPQWEVVKDTFLIQRSARAPEEQIGKALGYPVGERHNPSTGQLYGDVYYFHLSETNELEEMLGTELDGVSGFFYDYDASDELSEDEKEKDKELMDEHWQKTLAACEAVGWEVERDTEFSQYE